MARKISQKVSKQDITKLLEAFGKIKDVSSYLGIQHHAIYRWLRSETIPNDALVILLYGFHFKEFPIINEKNKEYVQLGNKKLRWVSYPGILSQSLREEVDLVFTLGKDPSTFMIMDTKLKNTVTIRLVGIYHETNHLIDYSTEQLVEELRIRGYKLNLNLEVA